MASDVHKSSSCLREFGGVDGLFCDAPEDAPLNFAGFHTALLPTWPEFLDPLSLLGPGAPPVGSIAVHPLEKPPEECQEPHSEVVCQEPHPA